MSRFGRSLLGVILAGGESRRFGGEKTLHPLAGRPMARWVAEALLPWTRRQVVIANDPRIPRALALPGRPDEEPGLGPAGGLATALRWAGEEGYEAVFLLAGDLPLVSSTLVGRILSAWPSDIPAVVPWSPGPLALEPLCAGYEVTVLTTLEQELRDGRRSMQGVLARVGAHRVPPSELGSVEELENVFRNVNTRDDAARAEPLLLARDASREPSQGLGKTSEGGP